MIKQIEKNDLFSIFNIENFLHLETIIDNFSPSLTEYHLETFFSNSEIESFLNKRNIQNSLNIGSFSLYLDYDENIYLESFENNLSDEATLF
ncbi:hypothetical protein [Aliarcobacter skirrowii]|uniref:Uncharacterized protein n=1 Tax=Aliarcobacter skirrowii CCUG 10374 TaxID=1032239 RepID=A0AAD0SR10_9BACT|nr:hypothetical protein [Aliarcobacter skirrowii]AXX84870.1 hypothetical protein ASKIR_1063 [Aliarcobacter skirrowii CCUG 10374]KAB0620446.1 hypothetical protein F7P70_07595 [Aliarcobacter skirrowii CCUG 10374]RXI25637.1 hypothetical protein CP959_07620 [Aliarcobacter skirrowii CCUG 10374]SUU96607.1 Uncharacterised protein [Aliarcobacter skirrowii]